jgi:hypothetical protein
MQAPSGLVDDEEFKGLIGDRDDGDGDGLELTAAGSWRGCGEEEGDSSVHGSLVAKEKKTRRANLLFALAMFLFSTFTILNVLDPKHLSQRQREQIRNYRRGTALILNLHIRSHGGIAVSNAIGKAPNTTGCPSESCNHPQPLDGVNMTLYPDYDPWEHNMTARNIAIVRRNFHFLGWEYTTAPEQPLSMTNWEGKNEDSELWHWRKGSRNRLKTSVEGGHTHRNSLEASLFIHRP